MAETQARIDTLEKRLNDGFTRIGEALARGIEVENWERHWLELLAEYERLNDELAATPPRQVEMSGMGRAEREVLV